MVFSPVSKYLSSFSKTDNIYSWTSKEISEESIKTPFTSENSFFPKWVDGYQLPKIKVNGNCLKQDRLSFLHRNVVNLYNTYELITQSTDLNTDVRLGNCLFEAVKLTKNVDPEC